jgi:hypothetical protein
MRMGGLNNKKLSGGKPQQHFSCYKYNTIFRTLESLRV